MTTLIAPNLRPLSIPEILDRAVRLYRRNFLTLVGILAVVQIPLAVLELAVSLSPLTDGIERVAGLAGTPNNTDPSQVFAPDYFLGLGVSYLLGLVSLILVRGIGTAAMARAVGENYLGQPISLAGAYLNLTSLGAVIRTVILGGLYGLASLIWWVVPCVGWFTGLGLIAFLAICTSLAVPLVALEETGARVALRRAWDLARQRFWPVWWFMVALGLFSLLVVSGPSVLVAFAVQYLTASVVEDPAQLVILQTIIQSVISLILLLLYTPLQIVALTVLYFDLRVRHEGLDLAVQAATASGQEPLTAVRQTPTGTPGRWITSTEMVNLFVLTILFIALYFGLIFLGVGAASLLRGF